MLKVFLGYMVLNNEIFSHEEQIWIMIPLQDHDNLLVGWLVVFIEVRQM